MDRGAWWAQIHGVTKSQILSDFTLFFHFHALEKEMATHSSVLAWRIPGTGELGGLPSMGLHRVRHDLPNKHTHTHTELQSHFLALVSDEAGSLTEMPAPTSRLPAAAVGGLCRARSYCFQLCDPGISWACLSPPQNPELEQSMAKLESYWGPREPRA